MKIKILFLIPDLCGGGAEKVLINLVNNLDKNIFDVTVYSIFNVGINKSFLNNNINFKYLFPFQFRGWTSIFKILPAKLLHNILIKDKYDIEVAYLEGTTAKIISGCETKAKLISWIHKTMYDENVAFKTFFNRKEAIETYNKFDKIICVSKSVKESFVKYFTNIRDISCLFNVNESDSIIELSKYNIDFKFKKDEFNIISVGTVKSIKGYDRLAKIQKRLIDNGYKTHVYICGDGNQKNTILDYLKENQIENFWDFLGYTKNPYKYVSNADLFVCSSYSEGLSTVVTEALYIGTPVISTDVSGAKELLGKNNEYGLVVDNNEEALYDAIIKLLNDNELLQHYKKQALIRGKFFSKENIINQHEDLFKTLIYNK